jgi:hypothetical protein
MYCKYEDDVHHIFNFQLTYRHFFIELLCRHKERRIAQRIGY